MPRAQGIRSLIASDLPRTGRGLRGWGKAIASNSALRVLQRETHRRGPRDAETEVPLSGHQLLERWRTSRVTPAALRPPEAQPLRTEEEQRREGREREAGRPGGRGGREAGRPGGGEAGCGEAGSGEGGPGAAPPPPTPAGFHPPPARGPPTAEGVQCRRRPGRGRPGQGLACSGRTGLEDGSSLVRTRAPDRAAAGGGRGARRVPRVRACVRGVRASTGSSCAGTEWGCFAPRPRL